MAKNLFARTPKTYLYAVSFDRNTIIILRVAQGSVIITHTHLGITIEMTQTTAH